MAEVARDYSPEAEGPRDCCANLAMTFQHIALDNGPDVTLRTYCFEEWASRLERACAQLDHERARVAAAEQDTRRLREALQEIARGDELLYANEGAFNLHAARRMQNAARAALAAIPQEEPRP